MTVDKEKYADLLAALRAASPEGDLDRFEETGDAARRSMRRLVGELSDAAREEGGEAAPLLEELGREYPAERFWETVSKRVGEELAPFRETAFLREMDAQRRKAYFSAAFESMIRYQETYSYLTEELSVSREQLNVTFKVYNTLIQWVLIKRLSPRQFSAKCKDFFGWEEETARFLWTLLGENRPVLVERFVLRTLDRLNARQEQP